MADGIQKIVFVAYMQVITCELHTQVQQTTDEASQALSYFFKPLFKSYTTAHLERKEKQPTVNSDKEQSDQVRNVSVWRHQEMKRLHF